MCQTDSVVNWKDIYVIGSEGVYLCHGCEMEVVKFIRTKMETSISNKLKAKRLSKCKKKD